MLISDATYADEDDFAADFLELRDLDFPKSMTTTRIQILMATVTSIFLLILGSVKISWATSSTMTKIGPPTCSCASRAI